MKRTTKQTERKQRNKCNHKRKQGKETKGKQGNQNIFGEIRKKIVLVLNK
jgi:hypothetical protein